MLALSFCLLLFLYNFQPFWGSILLVVIVSVLMLELIDPSFFHWWSYMMFLVYVGGILILFVYISSLTPNFILYTLPPVLSFLLALLVQLFHQTFLFGSVYVHSGWGVFLFPKIYAGLIFLLGVFLVILVFSVILCMMVSPIRGV